MPFAIYPGGKHQLLQALAFQLGDLLNQLLGAADEAGLPNEFGVDQFRLASVKVGVVEFMGSEMGS